MLFTLCRRRRKVWIFLGLFWVAFRKWTPFIKRIETVTLAFLWWRELNISVRTNSIRSFFRSIMVLRLGIMCYRHSCLFFFKLHFYFLFLDRSRASSKWYSSHRRCSTCRTARSSIWDGESLSFVIWLSLLLQKPTHTAFIYSPQQEQVYPWCPSSQLCMGSLWWGHHLELPLALVYRWVLVLDECLTVICIARRELCVHYLSSNSSCRFVNGISCSVSCLTCNWSHELPWFFFYFVLLLFIRPMEQVQKVSCT